MKVFKHDYFGYRIEIVEAGILTDNILETLEWYNDFENYNRVTEFTHSSHIDTDQLLDLANSLTDCGYADWLRDIACKL